MAKKKKVLLTGATGYLGSHLARAFLKQGYEVAILKRSTSSLERLSDISTELIMFDLDKGGVSQPFNTVGGFEAVVHVATCYGRKGESPVEICRANSLFPLELLETATNFGSKSFFNTDTYFNTEEIECEYLGAYSLSKKHFSEWGRHYADSGKIRVLNIRLEHIFGPGEDSSHFTSWIVRQCLDNVPSISLTKGEQQRDFIYIDDAVSAYSCLIENTKKLDNGWFNVGLGSGKPTSIRSFVEIAHERTNSTSQLAFGDLPYRKQEIMYSCANTGFLNGLAWSADTELSRGLDHVIEFERRS